MQLSVPIHNRMAGLPYNSPEQNPGLNKIRTCWTFASLGNSRDSDLGCFEPKVVVTCLGMIWMEIESLSLGNSHGFFAIRCFPAHSHIDPKYVLCLTPV